MKFDPIPFLRNVLKRMGGSYLLLITLVVQQVSFFTAALISYYFVNGSVHFTEEQFWSIAAFFLAVLVIGNATTLGWTYYATSDARARLEDWAKDRKLLQDIPQETQAWKQINLLPLRFTLVSLVVAILGQTLSVTVYSQANSLLTAQQTVYVFLGGISASLLAAIIMLYSLDYLLMNPRTVLAPHQFEAQLRDLAAFPLATKLIGSTLALILIALLIVAPIGYRHVSLAAAGDIAQAGNVLLTFQVQSIIASLVVLVLGLMLALFIFRSLTLPVGSMVQALKKLEKGDFSQRIDINTSDEVGELAVHFNHMSEQIKVMQETLETQVRERTAQLRATVQVSGAVTAILDVNELIERVVNLIADAFGFYYVALFLGDADGKWAELKSATGEAGRVLRENKHRLDIEGRNMVGTAIRDREPKVAMDTAENQVRFDNPLLPYTRSEIALPLVVGERVLGALNAQSTREAAFGPEVIETLQAMANQIAIALDNARLYQEAQQNLQEMRAIQQQYLLTSWRGISENRDLVYENGGDEAGEPLREIEVPLTLRDQLLGQIMLAGDGDWTPEERNMIEAIASQAALALENARLVEDSQRLARRERLVAEITSKIWASTTIDGILQTTVREMGRALDTDEVIIELKA
ncbi:MAG: GAF domain-containing protein [Chloroflexota bacterium]